MNVYETKTMGRRIQGNPYVGRGIVLGQSQNGRYAAAAYFIMGRSENSRNRVFALEEDGTLFTRPFDPSKVKDPSLIIYAAARTFRNQRIVTNGDQTDTIYNGLQSGRSFASALTARCFEPDAPNFTPRISGMLTFGHELTYEMSILKSADVQGSACNRYHFAYAALPGVGHFIHTYVTDGDPIPTFMGEPERVCVPDDIDDFARDIWDNLNEQNKISLFVEYTDLTDGSVSRRVINKNQ